MGINEYDKSNADGVQIPYMPHLKNYQSTMEHRMAWVGWHKEPAFL